MQKSKWSAVKWKSGMQLVQIHRILRRGVKVMHVSKQPNRQVNILDHVSDVDIAEEALVL